MDFTYGIQNVALGPSLSSSILVVVRFIFALERIL